MNLIWIKYLFGRLVCKWKKSHIETKQFSTKSCKFLCSCNRCGRQWVEDPLINIERKNKSEAAVKRREDREREMVRELLNGNSEEREESI